MRGTTFACFSKCVTGMTRHSLLNVQERGSKMTSSPAMQPFSSATAFLQRLTRKLLVLFFALIMIITKKRCISIFLSPPVDKIRDPLRITQPPGYKRRQYHQNDQHQRSEQRIQRNQRADDQPDEKQDQKNHKIQKKRCQETAQFHIPFDCFLFCRTHTNILQSYGMKSMPIWLKYVYVRKIQMS